MKSKSKSKARRSRRTFNNEQRADAVRLVKAEGMSLAKVARDLDLTESALRNWVRKADDVAPAQRASGPLSDAERLELAELRKELRIVKMEREILKKATAFFARQQT